MTVDQLLYELGPAFCKYKLENEAIQSFGLNTNADGKKIELIIYKIGLFSHEKIAFVIACFNAFVRFSSDK